MEAVSDFIFEGSKITADGDCTHEIKKNNKKTKNKKKLVPWKKTYDQPRWHIKKQRHYFASNGPTNTSDSFSSSHCGCESWTLNKAECQRIDPFELWC